MPTLDDELPSPPSQEAAGPTDGTPIDDSLDGALLADVPKMGDAIPAGTYTFRLESFKEKWTVNDYKTGAPLEHPQPYFALAWKCQQEPHVGRMVFDNVPWVLPKDSKDANDNSSPRRGEARQILNNRLPKAKAIMQAAGFEPKAGFSFKQFLGTNPELKLQLKLREQMDKNPATGKYDVPTGAFQNDVQKYLSLHRPA